MPAGQTAPAAADAAGRGCDGKVVTRLDIDAAPPSSPRLPGALAFVAEASQSMHVTTQPETIRRMLLLAPGDVCTEWKVRESERLLRSQRLFRSVRVEAVEQGEGVRLDIHTVDEADLVLAAFFRAAAVPIRGARVGLLNLGGTARILAVEWRDSDGFRNVAGVRYVDRLFGGRLQELELVARRNIDGYETRAVLARPAYTDVQRFAYSASADASLGYAPLRRFGEDPLAIPVRQQSATLGGLVRGGPIGRLRVGGASLTYSTLDASGAPRVPGATGWVADGGSPLGVTFRHQQVLRANLLAGLRLVQTRPVTGFDALTAVQDVPIGVQVSASVGHSIPVGAARDRDVFVAGDAYIGAGGARSYLGTQLFTEARYDRPSGSWDGIALSGRAAWYLRPRDGWLTLLSAHVSQGYDIRSPFQLSLADRDGGVLGYGRSDLVGGRRWVLNFEQRIVGARALSSNDVGVALVAQAGRLQATPGVPYARANGTWQPMVGVALLGAPHLARRVWRLDVAVPVGTDPQRRFELRLTNADRSRRFWQEPSDIAAARESTRPGALFGWP